MRVSAMMSMVQISVAVVALLALLPGAPGVAADEVRIGVVNTARLLDQAPQARRARAELEQEFAPRDRELVETQRVLRRMEDTLAREGNTMNETERRNLEREIVAQKREIRRATDEFREDFNIRRNEELARLQRRIYETVVEVANQEGYDLILEAGVVFASEQVDITEKVLQRLQ